MSGKDIADTFEEEFAAKLNMSSPCAVDEHSVTSLAECQTMWKPSSNIFGNRSRILAMAVLLARLAGSAHASSCSAGKFAFPAWSSTGCKTCSSNSNSPAWSDLESQCVCNEGFSGKLACAQKNFQVGRPGEKLGTTVAVDGDTAVVSSEARRPSSTA